MRKPEPKSPSFEELMTELDGTVNKLEAGNLSLDESIKLYEHGMQLAKQCAEILDTAELRVKELQVTPEGEPLLIDLESEE